MLGYVLRRLYTHEKLTLLPTTVFECHVLVFLLYCFLPFATVLLDVKK